MIISKQICSYCSNESEIPQEFQEREPSSNSTQETGSNTTVVFSANSSQNSFRIGGGFFVGVEFKYANINVNSTSGSKVTPTEHFYCKDEDLKLPRVSFAVVLCSLFWDKPWNCSFATRFTLLLLNYRYQFFRQRFYTNFTKFTNMSCHLTRLRILMIVLIFIHHRLFHSSQCVYSHNSPRGRASGLAGTPDRFAHCSYKRRYQILGYS